MKPSVFSSCSVVPIGPAPVRKGSVRMVDIDPAIRSALDDGSLESVTLVEALIVDHGKLIRSVAPDAGAAVFAAMDVAMEGKITSRMRNSGRILFDRFGLPE